jgi:hypothetical protein
MKVLNKIFSLSNIVIISMVILLNSCGGDDAGQTNQAPVIANNLNDITLGQSFESIEIDLSIVITDPDGDDMTFSAESSDTSVVTVMVTANTLTIFEQGIGTSTITISGTDTSGESATDTFIITVE